MADPAVLSRGGELRGHKRGGAWGDCRLITETVSDYIKKDSDKSSMFSSPFSEPQRQEPTIVIAGTSSTFSYTSLQDCSSHCSGYIEMEGQV